MGCRPWNAHGVTDIYYTCVTWDTDHEMHREWQIYTIHVLHGIQTMKCTWSDRYIHVLHGMQTMKCTGSDRYRLYMCYMGCGPWNAQGVIDTYYTCVTWDVDHEMHGWWQIEAIQYACVKWDADHEMHKEWQIEASHVLNGMQTMKCTGSDRYRLYMCYMGCLCFTYMLNGMLVLYMCVKLDACATHVLHGMLVLYSSSSRLCPSTAGCSPPSMSSIVVCLLLS